MKQRIFKKVLFVAMITLVLLSEGVASDDPVAERIPVKTVAAKKLEVSRTISALGTINFVSKADVSAEIDGVLRSVEVEEGETVTTGQVLAVIDSTLLEAQLKQAVAVLELAQIEAAKWKNETRKAAYRVESNRITMENLKAFFETQKELFNIQGLSKNDLNKAESEYKKAFTEYQSSVENLKSLQAKSVRGHGEAEQKIAKAQADVDEIKGKLDKCIIKSPITGVVATQKKWKGERTKASDSVIVTLINIREVYAVAELNETSLGQIGSGQRAIVTADAYPGITFRGMVHMISPIIDINSRTVKVKVKIINDKNLLKHGMFVRIKILSDRISPMVAVPSDAIIKSEDGLKKVFVVVDGVAFLRDVQAKPGEDNWVTIFKGVREGEQVVVEGQEKLNDLSAVQIMGKEVK